MFNMNDFGSRAFAAVSSLTISAVLFAYAIVPAQQGALISGVVA